VREDIAYLADNIHSDKLGEYGFTEMRSRNCEISNSKWFERHSMVFYADKQGLYFNADYKESEGIFRLLPCLATQGSRHLSKLYMGTIMPITIRNVVDGNVNLAHWARHESVFMLSGEPVSRRPKYLDYFLNFCADSKDTSSKEKLERAIRV
jgi:hypothetical protein